MTVHYLSDVDDTLMTNYDGKLVFNEKLIHHLKSHGVTHINFLTKMDANRLSITSPIRLELIKHLAQHGITVDKIYTPLDLLFKTVHQNFPLGGVYEKHLKPVEEAVVAVKKINRSDFDKYNSINSRKLTIDAINFLLSKNCLDANECVGNINQEKENHIFQIIDQFILTRYKDGYTPDNQAIDFGMVAEIFNHIRFAAKNNPTTTIAELLTHYESEYAQELEKLPQLLNDNLAKITRFFDTFKNYRNLNYHTQLLYKNHPSYNQNIMEPFTKGMVYASVVEELNVKKEDTVVFIDDSAKEHTSVKTSHADNHYKHTLITSLPPLSTYFSADATVSEEGFQQNLLPTVLSQVNYLITEGRNLAEQGFHQIAGDYFKAAFCICPEDKEFQQLRNESIASYAKNYKLLNRKAEPDINQKHIAEQSLFISTILNGIHHHDNFATKSKLIKFAIATHHHEHPFFYSNNQSSLQLRSHFFSTFTNIPVNDGFQVKVLNQIEQLAEKYPEECQRFCIELRNTILLPAFKEALENIEMRISTGIHQQP